MSQEVGLPKFDEVVQEEDTEEKVKTENDIKVETGGKKLYKEVFKFDCHITTTRPQL